MTAVGSRKHDASGRSTGQRKVSRRTAIAGQFAPRTIDMLRSPAYRALSLTAHRVLARIEIELANHGGTENGRLPCTFDDLVAYGCHRHAVAPAIRELAALGFIEVTERGRGGNAAFRSPNVFRLTYRSTDRSGPTDDWQRFESDADVEQAITEARRTPSKKQNASAGKRHAPVTVSGTESGSAPVMVSGTTAPVTVSGTTFDMAGEAAAGTQRPAPHEAGQRRPEAQSLGEVTNLLLQTPLMQRALARRGRP